MFGYIHVIMTLFVLAIVHETGKTIVSISRTKVNLKVSKMCRVVWLCYKYIGFWRLFKTSHLMICGSEWGCCCC